MLSLSLLLLSAAAGAGERPPTPSVAEIVAKNAEARGGVDAWRKIETMIWVGRIESARAPTEAMPFMLEMKRPRKTRFEIRAPTQQAVRAFDGQEGWKARPGQNGVPDVQPFTPEELSFAKDGEGLDGLLIDCEAKGIQVALDGTDSIDGAKTYRLRVVLPSGAVRRVWVDAHSFLELRQDREVRSAAGTVRTVHVYYRNYATVGGVQMPMTIETGSEGAKGADKMVIERVAMNEPLDDRRFARPHAPRSKMKTVTAQPMQQPAPREPSRQPSGAAEPPAARADSPPAADGTVPK